MSERVNERMSTLERASEASSAEQANERLVRANERTEERMTQYSERRVHYRFVSFSVTCNSFQYQNALFIHVKNQPH